MLGPPPTTYRTRCVAEFVRIPNDGEKPELSRVPLLGTNDRCEIVYVYHSFPFTHENQES